MNMKTWMEQLLTDLYAALDAISVGYGRNLFKDGLEITWCDHDPEDVDGEYVRWIESRFVVFWSDRVLERLLLLNAGKSRALKVVLSKRTQWEVEKLGAKLEKLERTLSGEETG